MVGVLPQTLEPKIAELELTLNDLVPPSPLDAARR